MRKFCVGDPGLPQSIGNQLDGCVKSRSAKKQRDLPLLAMAKLEGKAAIRREIIGRFRNQPLMNGDAIGSGIEGFARLVLKQMRTFPLELARRNIGGIAHDQIGTTPPEQWIDPGKEIALPDLNPRTQTEPLHIASRLSHCLIGKIAHQHFGVRPCMGYGKAQIARSAAHVDHERLGSVGKKRENGAPQKLGFCARRQNARAGQ